MGGRGRSCVRLELVGLDLDDALRLLRLARAGAARVHVVRGVLEELAQRELEQLIGVLLLGQVPARGRRTSSRRRVRRWAKGHEGRGGRREWKSLRPPGRKGLKVVVVVVVLQLAGRRGSVVLPEPMAA